MTLDPIQAVFDHWNSLDGLPHVRVVEYHHRQYVKDWLKHYSVEKICQGLDNYHKVLMGRDYFWTYSWNLWELLTRRKTDGSKTPQFLQFLLDFNPMRFLKNEKVQRGEKENQPHHISDSAKQLMESYKKRGIHNG